MKRFLKLFRLEREERLPALVMLLFFVALTTVFVVHYYPYFSDFSYKGGNPFHHHQSLEHIPHYRFPPSAAGVHAFPPPCAEPLAVSRDGIELRAVCDSRSVAVLGTLCVHLPAADFPSCP